MPFAQEKMGFDRPPKLFLRQDQQNGADPMGKTGFYDPQNEAITIYISNRHPKDIMRSLAHELQHHAQKCNGDFDNVQSMGEQGYAQADPHMRSMEIQAYQASIVFRDWEDSTKGTIYYEHLQKGDKSSMSTKKWKNRELNGLLMEKFGFDFNPLAENLNEGFENPKSATGAGPSNKAGNTGRSDVANKATGRWLKEEEEIFAPNHYCVHHGGVEHNGTTHMAEAISHNYNEKLGRVTHYDMKLADGTILENVAAEDIQITDASLEEGHDGHAAKRDDDEEIDEMAAKRAGNEDRDVGRDRMHKDRMHEVVKKLHNAGYTKEQIKESLTGAFNKAKKG